MTETPEERARRLGLIPQAEASGETPEQRAARLGVAAGPITPGHSKFTPAQLVARANRAVTSSEEADEAKRPEYAAQALGGIASLARDIPGAEPAQAGVRSLVRRGAAKVGLPVAPETYEQSLQEIRGAEADAPGIVRNTNRIIGGGMAISAIPGAPMMQGALYGASKGLLQADPDAGVGERVKDAAIEGTVGALAGKASELATVGARTFAPRFLGGPKSLGAQEAAHTRRIAAADATNYGAAKAEGAAFSGRPTPAHLGPSPTTPDIAAALDAPDIKPFADLVRQQRQFAGADDATVLRETLKAMNTKNFRLLNKVDNVTRIQKESLRRAKQELLAAADPVMPSLRPAVQEHARLAGERDAMRFGADAAETIGRRAPIPGKKLATQSPEAIRAELQRMTPAQAAVARQGMLGRVREVPGVTGNPLSGFGVVSSAVRTPTELLRVAPYVRSLDQITGTQLPSAIRSLLVAAGTPNP